MLIAKGNGTLKSFNEIFMSSSASQPLIDPRIRVANRRHSTSTSRGWNSVPKRSGSKLSRLTERFIGVGITEGNLAFLLKRIMHEN